MNEPTQMAMNLCADDGLPSKLICVRYVLAICGYDPKNAEQLIADMIAKRKKFDDWCERDDVPNR